jgi:heat-inducible transcriptional repressor
MRRTERQRWDILDTIVRLHVETGQPVGSAMVARAMRGTLSSASIRTVMQGLEQDGYLAQPHTSAGRQPTDKGYRSYVDRYQATRRFLADDAPREVRRMVDERLQRTAGTHAVAKELASLLNELTRGIGIILGPAWDEVRALRLDLYPKEGRHILVVLVLENALVRSGVLLTEREYPPAIVAEAARLLSERISGRSVAEIRTRVLPTLDAASSPADCCAREIAGQGRELFEDLEESEIELEGVGDLLRQPEFSEPAPLRSLVRFLESPRLMGDALRRLSPPGEGRIAVWIGSENPVDELRPYGLLASSFDVGGRRGILAVLGPRRMLYPRAVSGIDILLRGLRYLR